MKLKFFVVLCLFSATVFGQNYQSHTVQKDRLSIQLTEGVLQIIPQAQNAIRIQLEKESVKENRELIFLEDKLTPQQFKFSETPAELRLSTKVITVIFNKKTAVVQYVDNQGKMFLSEIPGGRKLIATTVAGEGCFMAEQKFDSPADEYLFGLGQFQDGHFNLRNVSRKLIQVNSQIAIPFLYSSRGYGILWHQYGITEFNPADHVIELAKSSNTTNENKEAEVTTTSGTQKVSQRQALYTGKFSVDKDGEYSLMLDLGDMDNRHLVVIDDDAIIDQTNLWLPPAASKLVKLKAGEHAVQVVCNATNTPKLSWQAVNNATAFRSQHAKSLDYTVFYGEKADDVIATYRTLTGNAPLFPKWAYGFWQCRERYTSATHLVETVKEFRKRKLPMDVIVQDWQYWGKRGWGVPQLDETNYPNPSGFIKELHDLNAHFSISIWSNPDKKSEIGKAYMDRGLFIPDTKWLDYFNLETRKSYWNTLNENLFTYGVDSWWMDATEPENDALRGTKTAFGPGEFYRLTYPMLVSQSVYEGQRATNEKKRVCILTRSAFPGQQRYGVINWSGDIGWTWDTYKRQIVAGLNFTITGLPYWTTDIGGFFRPGQSQYTDEKYHELLTRWFQWGAFSPIFRIHGYQTETEPWKYGTVVEENIRKMLNLRYRLIPYIYSEAWQVTSNGSTMMRPLVMDFKNDSEATRQPFEYMFGQSFLVMPVTEPGVSKANVYLPKNTSWYDFWTGRKLEGGRTVETATPLDKIPLFVKAGSIIPMTNVEQSTTEIKSDTVEVRIYPGANGRFDLYNDEGDNYNYENGVRKVITFNWNDSKQILTIEKQKGTYNGNQLNIVFNIVWVNESLGSGMAVSKGKFVAYNGDKRTAVKK